MSCCWRYEESLSCDCETEDRLEKLKKRKTAMKEELRVQKLLVLEQQLSIADLKSQVSMLSLQMSDLTARLEATQDQKRQRAT